ncbi:hypothetical protein PoB_006688200 [Plakobranchus ocellatus]|uniref:Uncharacterized protein n=1 Tax=Plakobranchus ocellatus TaxID=259542 RepID=A0AAV4D8A4_9GAST|nr:hypothetical protein PoB_006688200 [Plakobranchus ocellatus]
MINNFNDILLSPCILATLYELSDSSVYNQSNCGTKVTSILTLMVNLDLHNKRLACLSYNKTYIEGFDITDLSELFVVSVPHNEEESDLQFPVKALLWITVAMIIFLLAQQITNFTSSMTGGEGDYDRQRMETLKRYRMRSQIKVPKTVSKTLKNEKQKVQFNFRS